MRSSKSRFAGKDRELRITPYLSLNLKTGVVKAGYDDLIINESYRRLAEYYGCAVVPARVRKVDWLYLYRHNN